MIFTLLTANLPVDAAAAMERALRRILSMRGLTLATGAADYTVEVTLDPTLQNDRYIITPGAKGVSCRAASVCACFAALGKLLHMSSFDGEGGFIPSSTPVDFTPKDPVRGMYFATHFHNFYHNAQLQSI